MRLFKDNSSIVICSNVRGKNLVQHYHANNYGIKLVQDQEMSIGLSDMSQLRNDTHAVCSFTRKNQMKSARNYFEIKPNALSYLVHAYGYCKFYFKINLKYLYFHYFYLLNKADIGYHGINRGISNVKVDLLKF